MTDLWLRSAVVGAYLVALLANGEFDLTVGLITAAIIAIWVTPVMRRMRFRRSAARAAAR